MDREYRTSYGIGGAGNMRRASVTKSLQQAMPWNEEPKEGRRSSIWSSNGESSERRGSLFKTISNTFRKNSTSEEAVAKDGESED